MTAPTDRAELVPHDALHCLVVDLFAERGVPPRRAELAAAALCHGDLCGFDSHGVFNLERLYLPKFEAGQIDPAAEPEVVTDLGACAVVDAHRALGLWSAAEVMDGAADRAAEHGIGLVSVRGGTHFGCAGFHALRAAERGMIGVVASNCGGQRIARPPHGARAVLGTNPLSVAAPALPDHPFLLDMSTTTVPTGKVRTAASSGEPVPRGWLTDDAGQPVTDPAAFDAGRAHLTWLGGSAETGAHKGYGLALVVEVLAALLSGSGVGPAAEALGGARGEDDDIGFFVLALSPDRLRTGFAADAHALFSALVDCPSTSEEGVRYPGWWEAERARHRRQHGVPVRPHVHRELLARGLAAPETAGGR
jgi:LDH2 family malate/lactate/ureidoglycolate dehydrogenase